MGSKKKHLTVVAALLAVLAATAATAFGAQTVMFLGSKNHTPSNRPMSMIRQIVVHTTEGNFWSAVRWLRNPASHGSSHYVVSQQGEIVQLVSTTDVAWHAGNRWTNRYSIGIEHEGYAKRKGSITEKQYRASARLVAYLATRANIPLDREHIIGHNEVPDPTNPRRKGGIGHHHDPGKHWRWRHYMALIRHFAKNPQKPRYVPGYMPPPVTAAAAPVVREREIRCGFRASIHSTTLYGGQTLAGLVPWYSRACGRRIHTVQYLIDGKLVWTDRERPFRFARGRFLNTTRLANGRHTLTMRAIGYRGHTVRKRLRIRVANPEFRLELGGVHAGQAVSGVVEVSATPNVPAARVGLYVDGELVHRDDEKPFTFKVPTAELENGEHQLAIRSQAVDGRMAGKAVPIVVANRAEGAASPLHIVWQSVSDWQTVRGPVAWQALVSGDVRQVEFWIDGKLRGRATEAPFSYAWNAGAEAPGDHELAVRAIGADGWTAQRRTNVRVERS